MEDEDIKKLENEQKEAVRTEVKAPVGSSASVSAPAKKSGKMKVAMVGCVILAMVGIGFGVYGVVQGDAKNAEIEKLTTKLKENEGEAKTEDKADAKVEDETKSEPVAEKLTAKDYIYVGEWGIKIKIPQSLSSVSYVFHAARATQTLYVSGVDCSDGACQYVPDFVEDMTERGSGLGAISRYPKSDAKAETIALGKNAESKDGEMGLGEVVYIDDDYFYTYVMANGIYSSDDSEVQWEVRSGKMVGEMLKKNISEF